MKHSQIAAAYATYFEKIAPDNLDELASFLTDDVVFIDPFNELHGKEKMVSIFSYMFESMNEPQFKVLDLAYSEQACYLKWRMTGQVKSAPKMPFDILGMSEVHFNEEGLITRHHDHWDASGQLLSKLPYIGWITRKISSLFAH